jgi:hypothetical protein
MIYMTGLKRPGRAAVHRYKKPWPQWSVHGRPRRFRGGWSGAWSMMLIATAAGDLLGWGHSK